MPCPARAPDGRARRSLRRPAAGPLGQRRRRNPRDRGGTGAGGLLWRLSLADVAAEGPFSAFRGLQRIITALEGGGLILLASGTASLGGAPLAAKSTALDPDAPVILSAEARALLVRIEPLAR